MVLFRSRTKLLAIYILKCRLLYFYRLFQFSTCLKVDQNENKSVPTSERELAGIRDTDETRRNAYICVFMEQGFVAIGIGYVFYYIHGRYRIWVFSN